MMLMNIVTVASIDDEEKSKPTRERKRKKQKKKKPQARTTFYDILLLSRARAGFFSLSLSLASFLLLGVFFSYVLHDKENATRVRLSSSMTILRQDDDDDDDDDSFQNVAKSDFRKKKRIYTRLKSPKDYQ